MPLLLARQTTPEFGQLLAQRAPSALSLSPVMHSILTDLRRCAELMPLYYPVFAMRAVLLRAAATSAHVRSTKFIFSLLFFSKIKFDYIFLLASTKKKNHPRRVTRALLQPTRRKRRNCSQRLRSLPSTCCVDLRLTAQRAPVGPIMRSSTTRQSRAPCSGTWT